MVIIFPFVFPLWIWFLIGLDLGFIFYAIDDDDEPLGTGATVSVLILLGILQYFTTFKAYTWVWGHPVPALLGAAGYFVIGAGWSVVKWWFAEKARVRKAKRQYGGKWREEKTQVAQHKSTMLVWIGYWPFSLIWTLLKDHFKRLVLWIYERLQQVYQRITDRVWS